MSKSKLVVLDHPAVQVALAILRDEKTEPDQFRRNARIVASAVVYEATRDIPIGRHPVQTPLKITDGHRILRPVIVVPVLRAGLSMADPCCELVPTACVHHIGIARNEATAEPERYYPTKESRRIRSDAFVILTDPMLATGGSANDALDQIKAAGGQNIRVACIVAAKDGVAAVHGRHPDVAIYTAALDPDLNGSKYIVPGLGDFGDRLFGTC